MLLFGGNGEEKQPGLGCLSSLRVLERLLHPCQPLQAVSQSPVSIKCLMRLHGNVKLLCRGICKSLCFRDTHKLAQNGLQRFYHSLRVQPAFPWAPGAIPSSKCWKAARYPQSGETQHFNITQNMLFPLFFTVEYINFCKSLPIFLTSNNHLIIISFPDHFFYTARFLIVCLLIKC